MGGVDTISVDKNDKLYKFICTSGFHRIYSTKDIISSVTLNVISNIDNSGQSHWFPTNVESVSIKDCTILSNSQLTNMCSGCTNLTSFEATNFNTANATSMENAFSNCSKLVSLNLSNLDTKNVTNMNNAFSGCGNLTSLDLSGWNTNNVRRVENMFSACGSLTSLILDGWSLPPFNQISTVNMFGDPNNIHTLINKNISISVKKCGVYTEPTIKAVLDNMNIILDSSGQSTIKYSFIS